MRHLRLLMTMGYLVVSVAACRAWEVRLVHPFVEATADELASRAASLPVAEEIQFDASRNDWVHAGLLITAGPDEQATVTIGLTGEGPVVDKLSVRPVGFVNRLQGDPPALQWSLDVIFNRPEHDLGAGRAQELKKWVRNAENLAGWPAVIATARDPVFLWFTADTRGVRPGLYAAALKLTDAQGMEKSIPIRLAVRPISLRERNPLRTLAWQCLFEMPTQADFARYLLDYGINVSWAWWYDQDIHCRQAGWDFYLYTFGPAWSGKFPAEYAEAEAQAELDKIRERVQRLGLAAGQFALCLKDEPPDEEAPRQAAWCQWLRERWPDVPIWCNIPWGPGINKAVTVDGLIRTLQPYVDVWCPYSWHLWHEDSAGMLKVLGERAREVWFYEIMNTDYARRPDVGRGLHRSLGWIAWRYGLQGCAWFSLNDYADWPWLEHGRTYSAMYYTMPTRALEAVRQGLVEYKTLLALRELGAPAQVTETFCERLFAAQSPEDLDAIRKDMYDTLEKISSD
ncbi:MAG: hypothetical protein N2512_12915 [Armatimonadetes bacterium]|nr:hypothetical protein [Armatimonadota bacterium]